MCFVLYAGTSHAKTQTEWRKDAPDLSVNLLTERENPIAAHFSKPHVQNIGSTSGCGCDFPHVMSQNDGWPSFDGNGPDPEQGAGDRYNRERLVALLRETGESTVELHGVWDGNFDFTMPPKIREEIPVDTILQPDFQFKEGALYVVGLTPPRSPKG
jgi:hypothetical protein